MKRIPPWKIQVPLPLVSQCDGHSCGAACVLSVLSYFHVPHTGLERVRRILRTNETDGTRPMRMVNSIQASGLECHYESAMDLGDLRESLDAGRPVICLIQAHGDGHYVVAAGIDNQRVYVMDPLIDGHYGYLSRRDFATRWFDAGYPSFGITVYRKSPLHCLRVLEVPE